MMVHWPLAVFVLLMALLSIRQYTLERLPFLSVLAASSLR